jgi:methyl-accepting chemotaxis protein
MLNNTKVAVKVYLVFGIPMLLMVIMATLFWTGSQSILERALLTRDESSVFVRKAYLMNQSVIQVQQYLNDISATRGLNGLNSGFDEAKKAAEAFKKEASEFRSMFKKENDTKSIAEIDEIERDFDKFYAEGKHMAEQYVLKGPEGGNPLMASFDQIITKVSADVDGFVSEQETELKESMNFILTSTKSLVTTLMALFLVGALVGTVMSTLITRAISVPLENAARIAASGDLSLRMGLTNKDEVGVLAQAFDAMAERLTRKTEEARAIASGDLTVKIDVASGSDTLGKAFESMCESLVALVKQVQTAVNEVASGAGQVSSASQAMSQGATEAASSLEEISSSMTEISSQTQSNAENSGKANELVRRASAAAVEGKEKIATTVSAMSEITTSSLEIAKIIKVIDDIAFQTNLLALNAAVEAARAGKHGKGFAVVADEVRNLAGRSATAAKETAELIESAKRKADVGMNVASETAVSFEEIVQGVAAVKEIVGGIATSSNEQASGIGQVSTGLSQIDAVTQQNTATAEETAAAAEELSSQAQVLLDLVGKFKIKDMGVADSAQNRHETRTARNAP